VQHAAYRASVELAREKGAFPLFDRDEYLKGEVIRALPADIRDGIAEHGIRNALVTSIAPTGTISLFAGNVSSGIEPVFAYAYTRKVLMPDGSRTEEEVEIRPRHPPAGLFRQCPDPRTDGPCADAGRGAEAHRQLDLEDHQLSRRH
jgi:hypothetical protein